MSLPEDTILVNRYRIDGLLAHGGMGAIYRAFDTNLNMPVAIKENFFHTPQRIAQFKQEALILARLRHPALPRVIHHFSFEGQQYLVMDFVEGEDLWEIIKRRGQPLDERTALTTMVQVCQAVNYLHQQHPPVIHRDIKPQNIKITPAGQAVLVDFGIAKQLTEEAEQTQTGAQAATPGFSPPEQYSHSGTTPASDVYALGATLYAIVTGKKPPNSVSLMVDSVKFKAPNVLNPSISSPTNQAIIQAMQPRPQLRPQSVTEWRHQLEAVLRTLPQPGLDETFVAAPPKMDKTLVEAAASPARGPETTFWLVDSRGAGYPLSEQPLRIGRHLDADVVIDDLNVSRSHALVKIEGARCLVLDEASANGTFLNGRRLGQDWAPFIQGDALIVGPARFYLTATRPMKIATPRHKSDPETGPPSPQLATTTDKIEIPTPVSAGSTARNETSPKSRGMRLFLLAAILLALLLLGGYVWFKPNPLATLSFGFGHPAAGVAATTPAPAATDTGDEFPVQVQAAATTPSPPPDSTPAVTDTPIIMVTPQTATPRSVASDSLVRATASISAAPGTAPETATATSTFPPQATATAAPSPTKIAQAATRQPAADSGPTAIPLKSSVSRAELGRVEVIDVDINPRNPAEVYALVKGDGIYKSINDGAGPWARIDLNGASITTLAIDPQNPLRLYAPTWNAVLKSEDGGNTWEPKTNGLLANRAVDTVTIHPDSPNLLYAGIGETLVVSIDHGENWSSAEYGHGLGVSRLTQIVVDPFQPDTITVAGLAGSLYKSTDGGRNFVQLPVNVGRGAFTLAAHPSRPNVYLVGINSWDAGMLKTENGLDYRSVSEGLVYGGADSAYSALAIAPADGNVVYAGSGFESNPDSKGIFKSTNAGESWTRINRGLAVNPDTNFPYYVKSMVVHPTNANIVYAATGSGLYKSSDGGQSWALQ